MSKSIRTRHTVSELTINFDVLIIRHHLDLIMSLFKVTKNSWTIVDCTSLYLSKILIVKTSLWLMNNFYLHLNVINSSFIKISNTMYREMRKFTNPTRSYWFFFLDQFTIEFFSTDSTRSNLVVRRLFIGIARFGCCYSYVNYNSSKTNNKN